MSVVILEFTANESDIKKASEEYKKYIKVTADIEKELVAIGGEFHADAEELLLKKGAKQVNVWGGGLNLETGQVETNAIINIRSKQNNPSSEILDSAIRETFITLAKKFLKNYVK